MADVNSLMRLARRAAYWLRFRRHQADLGDELAFHREQLAQDLERRGLSPDAARLAARREMGNETYMREEARGVWLSSSFDALAQDFRYAWRSLRRSRGFTAVVVATLALGFGANTAIFTVVDHLLLAPLPYADGNRIVRLDVVTAANPDVTLGVADPFYQQWVARSKTLEDFASIDQRRHQLGVGADGDTVTGASISPSVTTLLRVRPALGREFTADDAISGAEPVVMMGYGLWQSRYGGARDVLGKVISVDGVARVVVGVAPKHMSVPVIGGGEPDVWFPLQGDTTGGAYRFARLRPGVTSESAARELRSILITVPTVREQVDTTLRAKVFRPQDELDANETRAVAILLVATGALLLIACANIANLLLMRGWTRQRELVIRRALGASRVRLARHALAKCLILATIGGAFGLAVAWRGLHAIVALRPGELADLDGVHIDMAVLGWTTAIALASGLLFGIAPALLSGAQPMGYALRAGVRTAAGSRAASRLRGGMIVAEVALSVVFLVAAGLLVRSFVALEGTSIGYDRAGLVAVRFHFVHPPAAGARDGVEQTLVRTVSQVFGLDRVALGGFPGALLETTIGSGPYAIDGPDGPRPIDLVFCETPYVGRDYFRVVGVPLVQGRGFDGRGAGSHELVVNEALARRLWPNGNALGARLRVGRGAQAAWLTVVGIAGDLRLPGATSVGELFKFQMYRPATEADEVVSSVVVRLATSTSATMNVPALRGRLARVVAEAGVGTTIRSVDPAGSTFDVRVLARPRFALVLFGLFAMIALAVAAIGLYAIVAYAVAQRTREIGVRMALGADAPAVAKLVLGTSARLVAVGACVGLLGAYGASWMLTSLVGGAKASDPAAFGGAVVVLGLVAAVASVVPMRRAMGVDVVEALRGD